jgi:hypothetical protein
VALDIYFSFFISPLVADKIKSRQDIFSFCWADWSAFLDEVSWAIRVLGCSYPLVWAYGKEGNMAKDKTRVYKGTSNGILGLGI